MIIIIIVLQSRNYTYIFYQIVRIVRSTYKDARQIDIINDRIIMYLYA